MKTFFSIFIFVSFHVCYSQTWISLPKETTYIFQPHHQFVIDQYRNSIWILGGENATVIENSGNILQFDFYSEFQCVFGGKCEMAFNQNHIYVAESDNGLHTFDGYFESLIFATSSYGTIATNEDSVYITSVPNTTFGFPIMHVLIGSDTLYGLHSQSPLAVKNGYQYIPSSGPSFGFYSPYYSPTPPNYNSMTSDPEYIIGNSIYDYKFSKNSDTLWLANEHGLFSAYAFDFISSRTPSNTSNMPNAEVLEFEFDEQDRIWALFGDGSGNPTSIARLDGNVWTNFFDSNNSPIDFSTFFGLETDTLGNIWVLDNNALHTLLNPNSPNWLSVIESNIENSISVHPNPSTSSTFNISLGNHNIDVSNIKIVDVHGKSVDFTIQKNNEGLELVLPENASGVYLVEIELNSNELVRKRAIVFQ